MAQDNNNDDLKRITAIADVLLEHTEQGTITWSNGWNESEYTYSTPSSSVKIKAVDNDDNFPFLIEVLNSSGTTVSSVEFDNDLTRESQLVSRLYRAINRAHLKVDETLDGLLAELKNIPPF